MQQKCGPLNLSPHSASFPNLLALIQSPSPQARVEDALRRIGANNVEAAMEWLIMHPEAEPQPATSAGTVAPTAAGTSAGMSS